MTQRPSLPQGTYYGPSSEDKGRQNAQFRENTPKETMDVQKSFDKANVCNSATTKAAKMLSSEKILRKKQWTFKRVLTRPTYATQPQQRPPKCSVQRKYSERNNGRSKEF